MNRLASATDPLDELRFVALVGRGDAWNRRGLETYLEHVARGGVDAGAPTVRVIHVGATLSLAVCSDIVTRDRLLAASATIAARCGRVVTAWTGSVHSLIAPGRRLAEHTTRPVTELPPSATLRVTSWNVRRRVCAKAGAIRAATYRDEVVALSETDLAPLVLASSFPDHVVYESTPVQQRLPNAVCRLALLVRRGVSHATVHLPEATPARVAHFVVGIDVGTHARVLATYLPPDLLRDPVREVLDTLAELAESAARAGRTALIIGDFNAHVVPRRPEWAGGSRLATRAVADRGAWVGNSAARAGWTPLVVDRVTCRTVREGAVTESAIDLAFIKGTELAAANGWRYEPSRTTSSVTFADRALSDHALVSVAMAWRPGTGDTIVEAEGGDTDAPRSRALRQRTLHAFWSGTAPASQLQQDEEAREARARAALEPCRPKLALNNAAPEEYWAEFDRLASARLAIEPAIDADTDGLLAHLETALRDAALEAAVLVSGSNHSWQRRRDNALRRAARLASELEMAAAALGGSLDTQAALANAAARATAERLALAASAQARSAARAATRPTAPAELERRRVQPPLAAFDPLAWEARFSNGAEHPESARAHTAPPTPLQSGEVSRALDRVPRGRALGADNIPVELLLRARVRERAVAVLERIVRAIAASRSLPAAWRNQRAILLPKEGQRPSEPSAYRPLALPSHLHKVIDIVLLGRLERRVAATGGLDPAQAAFQRGRSTVEHILRLTGTNSSLARYVALLDVRAAFDKISRSAILAHIERIAGADETLKALAEAQLSRYELCFETELGVVRIPTHSGIRQGAPSSPLLFNLGLDGVLRALARDGVEVLAYADDIAVLARDALELERALATCGRELAAVGLEVNKAKTTILGPGHASRGTYLGVGITWAQADDPLLERRHVAVQTLRRGVSLLEAAVRDGTRTVALVAAWRATRGAAEYAALAWIARSPTRETRMALTDLRRLDESAVLLIVGPNYRAQATPEARAALASRDLGLARFDLHLRALATRHADLDPALSSWALEIRAARSPAELRRLCTEAIWRESASSASGVRRLPRGGAVKAIAYLGSRSLDEERAFLQRRIDYVDALAQGNPPNLGLFSALEQAHMRWPRHLHTEHDATACCVVEAYGLARTSNANRAALTRIAASLLARHESGADAADGPLRSPV